MPARGCGGDLIEKALMGKNPARHKRCGDTCPAEQISWEDVQGFIRKLNQKEGTARPVMPGLRAALGVQHATGSNISASGFE